jgi:hypothetical protein
MTVLQLVPRQMHVDNGALAAIAMRRTRWGPQDVLTAPTCSLWCGWQRRGRSYVN